MCIIVDNNVVHKVFLSDDDIEYSEMHDCLLNPKKLVGKIVYGGKLTDEYFKNSAVKRIILQLDKAGRAELVTSSEIDSELNIIIKMGIHVSDDEHILALARSSGARLLCTNDTDLKTDFQEKKLIDKPRGNIYCKASHKHLVAKHCKK